MIHAQGLVYMFGSYGISTNTASSPYAGGTGTGGVTGLAGASTTGQLYYYALLISSATTAPTTTKASLTDGAWANSGVLGQNYVSAGSAATPGNAGGTTATGWASGATDFVTIVGWSSSLGTTWTTVEAELASGDWAANGFFGVSGVGSVTAGGGTAPAAAIWGNSGVPSGSLTLDSVSPVVVPEPTTMALAGLGSLSLFLFRRRK